MKEFNNTDNKRKLCYFCKNESNIKTIVFTSNKNKANACNNCINDLGSKFEFIILDYVENREVKQTTQDKFYAMMNLSEYELNTLNYDLFNTLNNGICVMITKQSDKKKIKKFNSLRNKLERLRVEYVSIVESETQIELNTLEKEILKLEKVNKSKNLTVRLLEVTKDGKKIYK